MDKLGELFDTRQQQHYGRIPKVLIPENNLGHEAGRIENVFKMDRDVVCYRERPDRAGIRKGPGTGSMYVATFQRMLENNWISIHPDAFTTRRDCDLDEMLHMLREQMERFHLAGGKKFTGKGPRDEQDDLLIGLFMSVFWGLAYMTDKSQRDVRQRPVNTSPSKRAKHGPSDVEGVVVTPAAAVVR
jgi:hypothetical protein